MMDIYFINEESRAANYGIGTYRKLVSSWFKDSRDIRFTIIQLRSEKKEVSTETIDHINYLHIPNDYSEDYKQQSQRYHRNAGYLIQLHIKPNPANKTIFHFNYYKHASLVGAIKEAYPDSKICFTLHYLDWAFLIKGNNRYFDHIIHSKKEELENDIEKNVLRMYEMEKQLYSQVDKIICMARYTMDLLRNQYGVPDEKMTLIYNGIKEMKYPTSLPEDKKRLRRNYFLGEDEKIILFVGRLDEPKGVDILIEAFHLLHKEDEQYKLIIIGEGNHALYLQKCRNLWNKIMFTGLLNKEDVYHFYRLADVGVMPSTHEQCSYVAIEMMMHGLPLVISQTTGLNEMIPWDEFKLPIIEKEKELVLSPVELAERIKRVMIPKNKERLSAFVRNEYQTKYSESVFKTKMLDMYNNL